MGTERKNIYSTEGWMRNQERMAIQQQRRRVPQSASDLLGPGFGPTATQVYDWSSEDTSFNGMFYSAIGSINGPDSEVEWAGITVASDERLHGVQILWSLRDGDPPREQRRRYSSADGVTRVYTPWRGDVDWQSIGFVALSGTADGAAYAAPTLGTYCWKVDGSTVSVNGQVTLTTAIAGTTTGNITNRPMVQLPDSIIPSACPYYQPLSGSFDGAMTGWVVGSDGIIQLSSLPPNVSPSSGYMVSFGGTYSL